MANNSLIKPRPSLNLLHGVRALAALSVVIQHTFQSFAFRQDHPILSPLAWKFLWLLNLGELPVIVFLILSGILLHLPNTQPNLRSGHDTREFIKRRFLRIVPPYWATSIIGIALSFTPYFENKQSSLAELISHLTLTQNILGNALSINNYLWTVPVEFQVYLIYVFVLLPWLRKSKLTNILLMMLSSLVFLTAVFKLELPFHSQFYVVYFACGMLISEFISNQNTKMKVLRNCLPICVGCIVALTSIGVALHMNRGIYSSNYQYVFDVLLAGLFSAALLVLLCCDGKPVVANINKFLAHRVLCSLASFSYSIYLTHYYIVICISKLLFSTQLSEWFLVCAHAVIVPVAILTGWVFSLICERPDSIVMTLTRRILSIHHVRTTIN